MPKKLHKMWYSLQNGRAGRANACLWHALHACHCGLGGRYAVARPFLMVLSSKRVKMVLWGVFWGVFSVLRVCFRVFVAYFESILVYFGVL